MGEARRRGTYEERRQGAIESGRIKECDRKEILFRKFDIMKDQNDEKK